MASIAEQAAQCAANRGKPPVAQVNALQTDSIVRIFVVDSSGTCPYGARYCSS